MFGWLRALVRRGERAPEDPVEALERERLRHDADRELDRFKDRVLEDQQHFVTRMGAGGLLPPRGEWPARDGRRR